MYINPSIKQTIIRKAYGIIISFLIINPLYCMRSAPRGGIGRSAQATPRANAQARTITPSLQRPAPSIARPQSASFLRQNTPHSFLRPAQVPANRTRAINTLNLNRSPAPQTQLNTAVRTAIQPSIAAINRQPTSNITVGTTATSAPQNITIGTTASLAKNATQPKPTNIIAPSHPNTIQSSAQTQIIKPQSATNTIRQPQQQIGQSAASLSQRDRFRDHHFKKNRNRFRRNDFVGGIAYAYPIAIPYDIGGYYPYDLGYYPYADVDYYPPYDPYQYPYGDDTNIAHPERLGINPDYPVDYYTQPVSYIPVSPQPVNQEIINVAPQPEAQITTFNITPQQPIQPVNNNLLDTILGQTLTEATENTVTS